MTTDPKPADLLVDPLSDIARRERRNLMVSSAAAILVTRAGLIPTQISALGIGLSAPDQAAFLIFLSAVVLYLLVAFVVYGFSDFLVWRHRYIQYLEKVEVASGNWDVEDQDAYDELRKHVPSGGWIYRALKPTAHLRAIFEFYFPILLGGYSVYALWSRAHCA